MRSYVFLTAFAADSDGDIEKARIYKVPAMDLFKLDPMGSGTLVGRQSVGGVSQEAYFYDLKVFRFRVRQAILIKDRDRCRELLECWNS